MTDFQRSARCCLSALLVFCIWAFGVSSAGARAGSIVSTLGLSNDGPFPGEQVGAAIQIGSTPISLASILYTEAFSAGPTLGETFSILTRNANGTVGHAIFSDFTLSYDAASQNTTAAANSQFILQANTSYWLMMVETPGTFGDWDSSVSFNYTSAFGVTIPHNDASVSFFSGSYDYLALTDGLQLFQVNGSPVGQAVPEPSALTLAALGGAVVMGAARVRRGRRRVVGRRARAVGLASVPRSSRTAGSLGAGTRLQGARSRGPLPPRTHVGLSSALMSPATLWAIAVGSALAELVRMITVSLSST